MSYLQLVVNLMLRKSLQILIFSTCFLGGYAYAQDATPVPTPDMDLISEAASAVWAAFAGGRRVEAGLLALVALVAILRKWTPIPWFKTDLGGSVLVLVGAFAGTLAAAPALSWNVAWGAFKMAAMAAGGYSLVKRIGAAALAKVPMPGWVRSLVTAFLALLERPVDKAKVAAKKAGDDAVRKKPADGFGPTGKLP